MTVKDIMEKKGWGGGAGWGEWLQEAGLGGCGHDQGQHTFLSPTHGGLSGLGSFD